MDLNKVYNMDCIEGMKLIPDNSIDSIVTDPPYELGFMCKSWDSTGIAYNKDMRKECLRVLKPGGHLLSFSGTRTYHRMAVAIEDAGFEVRDMIEWVYGSGFPKSLNIGKAVDKLQGNERDDLGLSKNHRTLKETNCMVGEPHSGNGHITKGTSEWEGWGTALKPAHEPICLARKPLAEKTVAENCLKWGTGGINIEQSRVTSNSPASQNNQDYENVCNEFSYIQQSYLLNLSDTFFLSHELSLGYLKHIFFVLSPYNNCDTITLHKEEILAHTFDKGLQDALYDYGLTVQRVDEYVQNVIKFPNFQDNYPTLFSFCDALLQKKVISFKDVVALSNDVRVYISDFIDFSKNNQLCDSSLLNSFFLVFPYIIMLINKTPTLYLSNQKKQENIGRFPANLILEDCEEVRECFPESGGGKAKHNSEITRKGISQDGSSFNAETCGFDVNKCQGMANFGDSGNASRFFKSIIYQAKASKSERNKGCEGLIDKKAPKLKSISNFCIKCGKREDYKCNCNVGFEYKEQPNYQNITKNNHPTVKPIALMEYLIKMVTPKGGIVLDPFAGSGTTLVAAKQNGFQYVGFELTDEYIPIIEARINYVNNS